MIDILGGMLQITFPIFVVSEVPSGLIGNEAKCGQNKRSTLFYLCLLSILQVLRLTWRCRSTTCWLVSNWARQQWRSTSTTPGSAQLSLGRTAASCFMCFTKLGCRSRSWPARTATFAHCCLVKPTERQVRCLFRVSAGFQQFEGGKSESPELLHMYIRRLLQMPKGHDIFISQKYISIKSKQSCTFSSSLAIRKKIPTKRSTLKSETDLNVTSKFKSSHTCIWTSR